ncbi:branched-chain amino acid ABC transporter permease [Halorarius litoreus]|uniref:branched-chain amino acid ABC transporter permease n=1 Tax=Halorarius litoreus TaxID=2962676 RepID=UPI0020CF40A4|nr:branched-chain amino acid ABC transporter permease [Halorarius litoreus]
MSTKSFVGDLGGKVRAVVDRLSLSYRHLFGVLGLVLLAVLPFGIGVLDLLKMITVLYFVMFIISWDFVSGYTDQVSFGHTFFFATGGYTSALLNIELGISPVIGIAIGVVLAAVGGLLFSVPALRIEGHYLALFTLLPPLILLQVFQLNSDLFGGRRGLQGAELLVEMGDFNATAMANYYVAFALFLVIFTIAFVITRSDTGAIFKGIREDKLAVSASGHSPAKFKTFAMVVSAAIGGLAGAMFVHTPVGSASPTQLLDLIVMIDILLAAIIGGIGTIVGPTIGGFIFWWLKDFASDIEYTIPVINAPFARFDILVFYLITLLILLFIPEGILKKVIELGRGILDRRGGGQQGLDAE